MGLTHFPHGISSYGIPVVFTGERIPWGNVYFVDGTDGNDGNTGTDRDAPLKTIGAAHTKATNGNDDYIFAIGTFRESLTITKGKLHIIGASVGPALQGLVRWNNATSGQTQATVKIQAQDVEIAGFRIGGVTGASGSNYSPVLIDGVNGAHRCWIHHCNVGDYDQSHATAYIQYGIAIDGSYQNVIEENYVTYCMRGIGIPMVSSGGTFSPNHNIIRNNLVVNCDIGIYITDGSLNQVYGNTIDKGDAENDSYGIWVSGNIATVVENWITGGYTKPWGNASSIGHNNYEDTTSAAIVIAQAEA